MDPQPVPIPADFDERDWRRPPTAEEIAATEEMIAEIYRERDARKVAEWGSEGAVTPADSSGPRERGTVMSVPVWVEQTNGRFVASAAGHPQVRAEADTRDAAVEYVRRMIADRTAAGELVFVDPTTPPSPTPWTEEERAIMRQVVADIYRERDAQKAAEFPE